MKVVGLYLVRNEVDLIEVSLLHHFATAIDEAIVVDNGSSDGTLERVVSLAQSMPIQVASEPGPYDQSARVTRMARLAARNGADWVLPIDADEFWIGVDDQVRAILADTPPDVTAIYADVINFVQARQVWSVDSTCLLSMTMRPEHQIGPIERCEELVESRQIGFVEMMYPPKCVRRASPDIVIPPGNHSTIGTSKDESLTGRVLCLHAPLRARALLAGKIEQGRRVLEEDKDRQDYWHVRRWWRLAHEGRIDDEWAANSHEDGSIRIGGQPKPLVVDTRLRDAVAGFIPDRPANTDALAIDPAIDAYRLALDSVPGWFSELDFRIFCQIDKVQQAHGIGGDLFEIGAFCGKSAILLGYLAGHSDNRLLVCDMFEHTESANDENLVEFATWYPSFCQQDFVDQYLRFHAQLPTLMVGPSVDIDAEALAGTCRLVHVDGSHQYDIVRHDIATAKQLLGPGGIVAFDDICTAHNPGSALAIWEEVLSGRFVPLLLTAAKLYGTWDGGIVDWRAEFDRWVGSSTVLACETHTLAGWPVRRLHDVPTPGGSAPAGGGIPSLAGLETALPAVSVTPTADHAIATEPHDHSNDRRRKARRLAKLWAPPIVVSAYRRLKDHA